jgi:hypothetical protein
MAASRNSARFFLTSAEPGISQTIYSQSIGGYPSTSLVYPEGTLSVGLDLYEDDALNVTSGSVTDLSGKSYIHSRGEVINTDSISSVSTNIQTRAINEVNASHIQGADNGIVDGLDSSLVFNDNFNDQFKQYRCISIKNIDASNSLYDVGIYLRQKSRNTGSQVKIAVEMPKNDYTTGSVTSDSGDNISFIDTSLISAGFVDNHFATAVLTFTGGSNINQYRIISSYDSSTGSIVLQSSLPYAPSTGDAYKVDPGPSQRLVSAIDTPSFGTTYVSELQIPRLDGAIDIDISGSRDNGSDLQTNDIIYIWLERTLSKDSPFFSNNNIVIGISYSEV